MANLARLASVFLTKFLAKFLNIRAFWNGSARGCILQERQTLRSNGGVRCCRYVSVQGVLPVAPQLTRADLCGVRGTAAAWRSFMQLATKLTHGSLRASTVAVKHAILVLARVRSASVIADHSFCSTMRAGVLGRALAPV